MRPIGSIESDLWKLGAEQGYLFFVSNFGAYLTLPLLC